MNSKYYGKLSGHLDEACPPESSCTSDPNRCQRYGIILPIFTEFASWPFGIHWNGGNDHIWSDATWGGETSITNSEFHNFKVDSNCAHRRQRVFGLHRFSTDYMPEVKVSSSSTILHDVDPGALAYFTPRKGEWAVAGRCGEFACTAPHNIIISFDITGLF